MILVVDNYDSFTFNLVQALQAAGADVRVVRNDAIDQAGVEALADDPEAHLRGIVISPGPGDPDDAGVSVATIKVAADRKIPLTFEVARFVKFILTEIFPGGRLPSIEKVEEHATPAGFTLTRRQSLQLHYARTLDTWAEALEAHKDEAIAVQSEEVYDRYMHYLTGCAKGFRMGYIDVNQFTLAK